MTEVVKRFMRDAHVGRTDEELAQMIAPHLGDFVFESSAVASWRGGRYRPSAETVFAIALTTGLRLDNYLFETSTARELDEVRSQLGEVLQRLRRLEGDDPPPPAGG